MAFVILTHELFWSWRFGFHFHVSYTAQWFCSALMVALSIFSGSCCTLWLCRKCASFCSARRAIMSFVGYFLLDKHFGSSIWEHNSSSTMNTGQDWHCDGEERQTHRMINNRSLLELPTEFDTQQLGKPMLQDQQNIWLVNILLPYDCMQVQASWNIWFVSW